MKAKVYIDVSKSGFAYCAGIVTDYNNSPITMNLTEGFKRYVVECELPEPETIESVSVTELPKEVDAPRTA